MASRQTDVLDTNSGYLHASNSIKFSYLVIFRHYILCTKFRSSCTWQTLPREDMSNK